MFTDKSLHNKTHNLAACLKTKILALMLILERAGRGYKLLFRGSGKGLAEVTLGAIWEVSGVSWFPGEIFV